MRFFGSVDFWAKKELRAFQWIVEKPLILQLGESKSGTNTPHFTPDACFPVIVITADFTRKDHSRSLPKIHLPTLKSGLTGYLSIHLASTRNRGNPMIVDLVFSHLLQCGLAPTLCYSVGRLVDCVG